MKRRNRKLKSNVKIYMLIICLIVLFSLLFVILYNHFNTHKYDLNNIESIVTQSYPDLDLVKMDKIDVLAAFGINLEEVPNSLFLTRKGSSLDDNNIAYVIVINANNPNYYYDALYSYIDSNKMNFTNPKKLELYNNAIVKKGKNYTYMILGGDNTIIQQDINQNYK